MTEVKAENKGTLVNSMYRIMTSIENNLGGGEGIEGLYGSVKGGGVQKIFDCMRHHCGFTSNSHLVDIGAGLGRPLLHALVGMKIAKASGVELDRIKCDKAAAFLKLAITQLQKRGFTSLALQPPSITCAPIEAVPTLDPATHAYSFWEGVPFDARAAFGRLFASSKTLECVAVVQRSMREADPAEAMDDWYGFGPLRLVESFPVSMSGSGRNFMAYVFVRDGPMERLKGLPVSMGRSAAVAEAANSPLMRHSSESEFEVRIATPVQSKSPLVHNLSSESFEDDNEGDGSSKEAMQPRGYAGRRSQQKRRPVEQLSQQEEPTAKRRTVQTHTENPIIPTSRVSIDAKMKDTTKPSKTRNVLLTSKYGLRRRGLVAFNKQEIKGLIALPSPVVEGTTTTMADASVIPRGLLGV